MRHSTWILGVSLLVGCFDDPPDIEDGTSGDSEEATSGTSSSGATADTLEPGSSGEPPEGEPLQLSPLVCTNAEILATDAVGSGELVELRCGMMGPGDARVDTLASASLVDGDDWADVVEVRIPSGASAAEVIIDLENLDVSGFDEPVLRTFVACGADAPMCEVDWTVTAEGMTDAATASDFGTAATPSLVAALELDLAAVSDQPIRLRIVSSGVSSGLSDPDDVIFYSNPRIEEKAP